MNLKKKFGLIFAVLGLFAAFFTGCDFEEFYQPEESYTILTEESAPVGTFDEEASSETASFEAEIQEDEISEDGEYSAPEDVARYLREFHKLPSNFVTKKEAEEAGWIAYEGNLWDVMKGKSIGGDRFGNREGLLPDADGRTWRECDVNYAGGFRGAERILYSSDGLIYYTDDHYESFTEMEEQP